MEQSLYLNFVKQSFPLLVTAITEKLNDKRNGTLSYLYRDLLTPEYSVDGRWASVLAKYSRIAADVVSLDSSLPIKSGDSIELINGEIPKMGMKMYLTENQMKAIDSLIAERSRSFHIDHYRQYLHPLAEVYRLNLRDNRGYLPI